MTYKLLFVCLGNICRSPTAENIMNYLTKQTCVKKSSATLLVQLGIIGKPPDERMAAAAAPVGY